MADLKRTVSKEERRPKMTNGDDIFCLDDYDCIGFDMDHTIVQYHLPQVFKLIYRSFARYLIEKSGYDKRLLDEDFLKYEDYSLRGLTFEVQTGNFVKLDQNGFILRACHGMQQMNDDEIEKIYGKDRIWRFFPDLKKKIHHGVKYKCFENFFDMPIGVLCARIVDIIDEKNGKQNEYHFWPDVVNSLMNSFGPKCFSEHRGYFFSTIKSDADAYVKKCPKDVVEWLRNLRKAGKVTFLITQSHVDYTKFLMKFAIGENWMELFDYVITDAKKPDFFFAQPKDRPFKYTDAKMADSICDNLQRHCCYAQGTAIRLENDFKKLLNNKEDIKVVYFGDSPKSDIYPPHKFRQWHTVAILEEMEAEEVHFQKHSVCSQDGVITKRPRLTHLLKEEKIIVASKQWGSFFRHDKEAINGTSNCHEETINTFWGNVIREHCRIAIPLLDYLTDLPITHKFKSFSKTQLGFYPSPPSTVVHEH
eukprot:Seg2241.1 transcript_id=Seg2241.1/GoldUCD/mRNA.D3Y31 product="5'-nucleotidase domain-containing protein 1" protein_id=Seg2241.1/GoldUCD/D3Y31